MPNSVTSMAMASEIYVMMISMEMGLIINKILVHILPLNYLKIMTKMASVTMIRKIAWTTEAVVALPSD